ncbi:MAG: FAD-dependent oxidoreductase [Streptosporangiales bacterium]|nr:FAD-dependent oxidoreductase [Streptosporangiales bacterium]
MSHGQQTTVVIGAGPAGLTAAYKLSKADKPVVVYEASDVVGGISQTVERDGWRFDIGGHRFFTKVSEVEALWHEILDDDEFLLRPRMSRILYQGTFFDYPLKPFNALKGLGLLEAVRCVASYFWVRVRPPKDQSTFEGWVAARFGWRLYGMFFKTYTEKLWGVPGTEIQADWAAQRIKNLSLGNAIVNALAPKRNQKKITTLIDEFQYPKYGPGMMWERAYELVAKNNGEVVLNTPVETISRDERGAVAVMAQQNGTSERRECDHVISSMPLSELVLLMDPPAPEHVRKAAADLGYRDFLTIALVVPDEDGFPDNWIYVHTPGVHVGRVQNFGQWSPYMVKEGFTCLGLEYFVNEGDELWSAPDDELIELAKRELEMTGLAKAHRVEAGYVVRMPKAYPVYDENYRRNVDTIREWLAAEAPNVHPVGRNGMHKYNNQDHSMFTAMLTVENILAGSNDHDVWSVNVEEEYHEEGEDSSGDSSSDEGSDRPSSEGGGRDAPITPKPRPRSREQMSSPPDS